MKKIFYSILIVFSVFLVTACANVVAPLNPEDTQFTTLIKDLTPGVVAVTNESSNLLGSGVIVKKDSNFLENTYYVVTAQEVVENSLSIKIKTATSEYVGTVINKVSYYTEETNIVVVTFKSSSEHKVIPMTKIDDLDNLLGREIFAIGTPLNTNYFNMPTEPAIINLVKENILVHSTNLNFGLIGSPLFLKSTGQLIGINVYYSTSENGRPIARIQHAVNINKVMELLEEVI